MIRGKFERASTVLALGLWAVTLGAGIATAAPIAGFKVSTPLVEGLDVQVDLTAYVANTGTPASYVDAGHPIDFTFFTSYITSYNFGYGYHPTVYLVQRYTHSDWNTTAPAALDFGDFQTKQTVFLGLSPLAGEAGLDRDRESLQGVPTLPTYRGSFAHSYATAGTYNIKARLTPDGQFGSPGLGVATSGNPYYPFPLTGSWVGSPGLSVARTISLHIERTAMATTAVVDYSLVTTPTYPSTLRYIENSVAGLAVDAIPKIDISSPNPGANFGGNTTINFNGGAFDDEDGDLTPSLNWSSDLDGMLGSGGDFLATLSPGLHNITVSVMDSFGNMGMENFAVNVAIGGPNFAVTSGLCPGLIGLEVSGLAPGDKVAFYTGHAAGVTVLPGVCAGAVIDLDSADLRSVRFADGAGMIAFTRFFSVQQCNLLMQVVNLGVAGSACAVSNVLLPPLPPEVEEPGLALPDSGLGLRGGG